MSTGDHAHDHPERLFGHNGAILALTLAERLAADHPNVDPFVVNGVTIEQIADLVGHRTTIVTQKVYRYTSSSPSSAQARPCWKVCWKDVLEGLLEGSRAQIRAQLQVKGPALFSRTGP